MDHGPLVNSLREERGLSFEQIESSSPKDALRKIGLNWPSGSGDFLIISSMYFRYFVNFFPWKGAWCFM